MSQKPDYNKAKEIVEVKISFLIHLTVYVLVNAFLIVINLITNKYTLWFVWPLMGWGIGLLIHGIVAFLSPGLSRLRERMIEKELKKQK
jgi:hypothetical protein